MTRTFLTHAVVMIPALGAIGSSTLAQNLSPDDLMGWNYTVRLYRPRPEILNGKWTFPEARPAT